MKLTNVAEMKEMEKKADSSGYSYSEMMKVAGTGIANFIINKYRETRRKTAIGLIGAGNNGGDTLIALQTLQQNGWSTFSLMGMERKSTDPILREYLSSGGKIIQSEDIPAIKESTGGLGIVLDGLFGTGFHPPLPENIIGVLGSTQKDLAGFTWVAVDCPSGVDCETGEVSPGTVKADVSICLEAVKQGMLSYDAFPFCGELVTVDLALSGYSNQENTLDLIADEHLITDLLPSRPDISHKGKFGKVLVIGGSVNYPGAPVLAGRGAYAVGAGLVQVAIPGSIFQVSAAANSELTWLILEDAGGIISEIAVSTVLPILPKVNSLVFGPGIGREEVTRRFFNELLFGTPKQGNKGAGFLGVERKTNLEKPGLLFPPAVIDADGLYLLAKESEWPEKIKGSVILTPHPGEMAGLSGLTIEEIQNNRIEIAREYAQKWKQILVLKGALTVVAEPGGRVAVIPIATSSLAKGGTGDVLAGMIGGLLAQGLNPWGAAITGAWLHARAGILAARRIGCNESVLAGDVIKAVPKVYKTL